MFIATTTSATDSDQGEAMVLNARRRHCRGQVYGDSRPRLEYPQVEGARQVERILKTWLPRVIPLIFPVSYGRFSACSVLRGNDLPTGSADAKS